MTEASIMRDYNENINDCIFPPTLRTLIINVNQPISVGVLPAGLTTLTFGRDFNQPISAGVLPDSLTTLTFGDMFNQPITAGVLPAGLTTLTFGDMFNQTITAGVLPEALTTLTFGAYFNRPISAGVLPEGLTTLTFGYWFNQPISAGVLPASLTRLTLGYDFNHPISIGDLPASLTELTFGDYFNEPIAAGVLPIGLTRLTFGTNFNQPIAAGVLPEGLTTLTFGYLFNQPISTGVLPDSLTDLTFGYRFNRPIDVNLLPSRLKTLKLPAGHPNEFDLLSRPNLRMQRLQKTERARHHRLQQNERADLLRSHHRALREVGKPERLRRIRETYGSSVYTFVKLINDVYPDDSPEATIDLICDQLNVSKPDLREYWESHFGDTKQVFPNSKYHCNNYKLLDQISYTYLKPDADLIVDENNDCYTFDEFANLYRAARDRGSPFNSPYRSRTTFSDISPKYLGGLDIAPYVSDKKLKKFAESRY